MRVYKVVAWLVAASACGAHSTKLVGPSPAASQSQELLPDEQVQQALSRLTFGARPGDAEKVRRMGVDKWIDLQLHPERIDDAKADQLVAQYSIFNMKTSDIVRDYNVVQQLQRQVKRADAGDTTMNKAQTRQEILGQNPQLAAAARQAQQLTGEVQSAKLARAVTSDRQLNEV